MPGASCPGQCRGAERVRGARGPCWGVRRHEAVSGQLTFPPGNTGPTRPSGSQASRAPSPSRSPGLASRLSSTPRSRTCSPREFSSLLVSSAPAPLRPGAALALSAPADPTLSWRQAGSSGCFLGRACWARGASRSWASGRKPAASRGPCSGAVAKCCSSAARTTGGEQVQPAAAARGQERGLPAAPGTALLSPQAGREGPEGGQGLPPRHRRCLHRRSPRCAQRLPLPR